MSDWNIALKSLLFHWRVNLAVALGVAAATAVLTGALIVGDSMRGSLRDLTLDRLGKIDEILINQGFFREALADEISRIEYFGENYSRATPAIWFPDGTAETIADEASEVRRANQVTVLGTRADFWELGDSRVRPRVAMGPDEVVLNQTLADDLGIDRESLNEESRITVGIPQQKLLPSDSALGDKTNLTVRMVNLRVVDVIPSRSLGRFGIHPTQLPPRNAYLAIETVQEALGPEILKYKAESAQANVMFFSGYDGELATEIETDQMRQQIRPAFADLGMKIKRVTQWFDEKKVFDYYSISSEKLVIPDEAVQSIQTAFPQALPMMTYLANELRVVGDPDEQRYIPFSMVTGVDLDARVPLRSAQTGDLIEPLKDDEMVLNQWAAEDLKVAIGDRIQLKYFEPETTDGDEVEVASEWVVKDIVALTTPERPYEVGRRGRVRRAQFEKRPTLANDPDFTPEVSGAFGRGVGGAVGSAIQNGGSNSAPG